MTCIDLTSKRSKMLSYVAKHSKQRNTTKPIKLQWIASIGCQNDRNKAKLQKWSKSNDLHRFDVKTIKNVELRRKRFKTTLNYKSDQNPINWIDLMSKHSKQSKTIKLIKLQWIALIGCKNDQNNAKLQKWSKSKDFHRFDVKTIKNVELRRKTFKTTLNYKSDQNPMTCIDLTSKRSKMLSYVAKHSKQRRSTKPIKLQWIASIWCQNIQNNAKLQIWSKSNDLNRFDARTFKTKQNYKTDQITMNCIDWMSKRSKMLSYVAKHAKLQNRLNYNKLHRLDVKTFETKLNYQSDQNPMTCIDLTSKRSKMLSYVAKHSKQRKTTKQNKLQLIASIGCQNDRNKAKLQKWSKSNDLNRFDVKTFKTKQIYKTDQITINCIDWMSKRSKQS